jgi:hypothetical protein
LRNAPSVASVLCVLLAAAVARSEPTPKEIVDRAVDNQIFNLEGAELKIAMLLRSKDGSKRERRMETLIRQKDKLNRTVTRFVYPPDVARTAFLFIENKGRDDDQYMYLPALNVIRRIVGSQKDTSFMGSDFTYADLEARDFDRASHRHLPAAKVGKFECYVVETRPQEKTYSKLVSWIRKADDIFVRIDYYDKRGQLLKVFTTKEVKAVGGQKVLTRFRLSNKQTGHATVIVVTDIKLRQDLGDELFTERALRKR